jgi:hypothetical protein
MEVKPLFLSCCRFEVGDGVKTQFWEDRWATDDCFATQFPRIYSISNEHNITVKKAFAQGLRSLTFRRTLVGERLTEWKKNP